MSNKIGSTVYKLVYEYSHQSAHALNESENDAMAEYFNDLVTLWCERCHARAGRIGD